MGRFIKRFMKRKALFNDLYRFILRSVLIHSACGQVGLMKCCRLHGEGYTN